VLGTETAQFGSDYPDTLIIRHQLGGVLYEQGHSEQAEAELREVLQARVRVLGPDHPDTLSTRDSLAYWIGRTGDEAAAVELYRQLLVDRERVLGPDHPDTRNTRDHVSTVAVFGRVLGTVLQHQPDGSGPQLGIQLLRHDMHPSNSERMRHQTGKAPRGASTSPGCDPALGLGGRRARFRSGHIRRTGIELTRHLELFNHGSP
jgi:hypothetical protein